MIAIVVAYDSNLGIGSKGAIPWMGMMPDDMRHFKALTMGAAVIMGRLTYESIGRPLPGRQNIVLSRTAGAIDGCEVYSSLERALVSVRTEQDVFILGGGQIYRQAIDIVDRIYATEIDNEFAGNDTFFPKISPNDWQVIASTRHPADDTNKFTSRYVTYERIIR